MTSAWGLGKWSCRVRVTHEFYVHKPTLERIAGHRASHHGVEKNPHGFMCRPRSTASRLKSICTAGTARHLSLTNEEVQELGKQAATNSETLRSPDGY
ncbi:hypothetical protein ACLK1T_26140 [Escherichia coli]